MLKPKNKQREEDEALIEYIKSSLILELNVHFLIRAF
jgi:hypothetical protein